MALPMTAMITKIEADLIDALSDDYYGVWEFDWKLDDMNFPEERSVRVSVLADLVNKDYLDVFFGRLGDRSVPPLPKSEALSAVNDLANWRPREDIAAFVLFLSTTIKAEQAIAR